MTSQVHEKQPRSIESYPSTAVATVAPPVQVDLGRRQELVQMGGDKQNQELSWMSCGPGSRHLGPSAVPVVGRISLPKLKFLGGPKRNTEQRVENTLAADLEGTSSQIQHVAPTTSSYNCAMSTQAEKLVSVSVTDSLHAPHAYVDNKSGDTENKDAVADQDGGVECDREEFFDAENGGFLGLDKSNGEVGGPDEVDVEVDEKKTLQSPLLCTHSSS